MASFDLFITSLRNEFGEQDAGRKFEVFCKWFLENDPEWSKTINKVWLWDEYPNKWQRQDLGTDLVFKDSEGLVWAVQAKCYSEHRSTTKGDMNSFLADTGRPEVDRRLWLQTTNKIEAKAEKTYKGQDKPVTIFNLNNFRDAQIDYPSSFADLYQVKIKDKPRPDPHQIKAIEEVTAGLKTSDRGQMIMACGTGKTFTTLWIKEALASETTLVLLPSLSLLSQTMREWAWAGNADFEILNVCSDKSVGKKTEDMDPSDAPFAVTSEVHKISKFLKKSGPRVVFCTYQSSALITDAQLDTKVPVFDLVVADEAHRCTGKTDAGFATILDNEKIRASKRLFTTATPRYFGKAIKDEAIVRDLAVVGMDNEAVFGPVIHKLTFGQAIEQELLTDYQVVVVGVDEPMVREWIENYEIISTDPDNQTDARTLAAKIGLIKATKDYDLRRVISFHSRVKRAQDFSEELPAVLSLVEPENRPDGDFLSDYVSGEMKAGDRKDKIDRLKILEGFDRGILTNARCLAEGVDVPSLDGVAFIDPKGSQVEIIQAVGRAIRKVRGKKVQTKGTILIPVFIENGEDYEQSIEASNFKPVWDVLKALRAHDEVLGDELDEYRTNMAKNLFQAHENISEKIIFDIPMSVGAEFSSALRTVLVEYTTASWEFYFGLIETFKKQEGHCLVNTKTKVDGNNLGEWVLTQRRAEHTMDHQRKKRLDDIGFVWDPNKEAWEQGFQMLLNFKKREGHCKVPNRHMEGNYNLHSWCENQRKVHPSRVTGRNPITPERYQRLNELGFVWDVEAARWKEAFDKLIQFEKREGHCNVPYTHQEEGYSLGSWIGKQRQKQRQRKLTSEQKKKLNDIGLVWEVKEDLFETGFSLLVEFKNREGHCMVPNRHKENGFNLGKWVGHRREQVLTISADRKAKLDDIGFVWDTLAFQWEEGFFKLLQFKELKGDCLVPGTKKIEGFNLGQWVVTQRLNHGSISSERKKRLNDIGFVWDVPDYNWEKSFNRLIAFKNREGHFRIPTQLIEEEGFKLGSWVNRQRKSKSTMSPEKVQKLDDIGFIWTTK